MTIWISRSLLDQIWRLGEAAYPEEGAGLILGRLQDDVRLAYEIVPVENTFEPDARHNRYQIDPRAFLAAERRAEAAGLDVLGVFHSHPDHPAQASDTDLAWAVPFYSYLITRVDAANAVESRSWRLLDDRSRMIEETLEIQIIPDSQEER